MQTRRTSSSVQIALCLVTAVSSGFFSAMYFDYRREVEAEQDAEMQRAMDQAAAIRRARLEAQMTIERSQEEAQRKLDEFFTPP